MATLAHSLVNLREEVNQRWPARDKASDGWIGNDAHEAGVTDLDGDGDVDGNDAALKSQHNPDNRGIVHAIDIDKDGVSIPLLMAAFKAHPSCWYFIHNRKIYQRKNEFAPRDYTGANAHTEHIHISITLSVAAENNDSPWGIKEEDMAALTEAEFDRIRAEALSAAKEAVRWYAVSGDARDIGDTAQSVPLRMWQMGGLHALAARKTADEIKGMIVALATAVTLDDDVDEDALSAKLVPFIVGALGQPGVISQLSDALMENLAVVVNDERDKRERARLGTGQ